MAQENNNLDVLENLVNEAKRLQEENPKKSMQLAVMALSMAMVEYEEEKKKEQEQNE